MKARQFSVEQLEEELKALYEKKAASFIEKWNRLPPFMTMLVDRWQKASILGSGNSTSVYDDSLVIGDVKIGENTWVGPFTVLDGSGDGLTIGDFCSISTGVHIYTHDTVKWAVSKGKAKYEKGAVIIGSGVYIGPQSIITKGTKIGDHSVIGAFSLVNHDIPPYSIAWGQPARIVGSVEINEDGDVSFVYH